MKESPTQKSDFDWRLSLYAAASTLTIYLGFALFAPADLGIIGYALLVAVTSMFLLVLVARKKGKTRLSILSMMAVYVFLSAVLVINNFAFRDIARWGFRSSAYKAAILAQPQPKSGELRHREWDGWGWAGGYTYAYIVFDRTDALGAASKRRRFGKFSGIPCDVYRIRRLEKQWYAATFYTDANWDQCARQ